MSTSGTTTIITDTISSQLTVQNNSGTHTSEFSPSVGPGTTVINQRGIDTRSLNQFFGGDYDDDESVASDEDENDILLPFRNAVVYSRTDNHQRHSKNVFEFIVILLCLVPTTIFSVSASSVYLMIDSFVSEYVPNNEKSLTNFLQAQFLSVIVIITFIEFVKFLLVLVISVLFAFVVKVYTLDSHLTGGVKKNHKFFQYFHENLTNNPFCCLIGLSCCVLTGYVAFNIGLTYSIILLFISNITPEFSHLVNLKIAILINCLDWVLFLLYFIVYFKLQQKQKTLREHSAESEEEYYDDSADHQNVFESISNSFTSSNNRAPSSSDNI